MGDQYKAHFLAGVVVLFFGTWGLGTVFPEALWGVNAFAFLPVVVSAGLPVVALGLLAWAWIGKGRGLGKQESRNLVEWWLPGLLAVAAGAYSHFFPMVMDLYGDQFFIAKNLDLEIHGWDSRLVSELLSFDLTDGKIGTRFFYSIVNMTCYVTGWDGVRSFLFLQALGSGLFAWIWSRWILRTTLDWTIRISLLGIGLLSPLLLNFGGHFETYGFILVAFLGFASQLDKFFDRPGAWRFVFLVLLWLLACKFHITGFVLLPGVLLAGFWWWAKVKKYWEKLFSWKNALLCLVLPGFLLVVLVYVFVTDSWNGGRAFEEGNLEEVLFLPMKTLEEAPLDRYNLLSWAHILDFLNSILMPCAGGLFVLMGSIAAYKRFFQWREPGLMVSMMTLGGLWMVFFLMNPLLGLPFDWDLFCLSTPFLMLVVVWLAKQMEGGKATYQLFVSGLAISVLGASMLVLHQDREGLSQRYVAIGERVFKTSWISSSVNILAGLDLSESPETKQERLVGVISNLDTYGVPNNDLELANLYMELGKLYFQNKEYRLAEDQFKLAMKYELDLKANTFHLVSSLFFQEKYAEATGHVQMLASLAYPSRQKALRMTVHVCLEADNLKMATDACEAYVIEFPDDAFMTQVYTDLKSGRSATDLKKEFRSR